MNIDVALGGRGSAAAVLTVFRPYAGQPDLGVRIVEVTRQRAGHAWSAPQVLERERDRSYGPGWPGSASITVDRAGTSTVAYYGTVPSRPQMGVATSSARLGGSWSKPRLAIPRMGSEHPIEVAAARDRSVLVVAVRSYSTVLAALRPLGGGWRSPTTVAHEGRWISGWDAARDAAGGAVVAWTRCDGPGSPCLGVWASVMSPDGTWSATARLAGPELPDGEAVWVAMRDDEAAVAWPHFGASSSSLMVRTH